MATSFGRQFQPARSAILSPSFCGASTVGAFGRESFAYPWQSSAVYVFVACLAQGNTVGDIVTQFFMVFPRLDVVRLNSADRAALLAGVIVSLVDRITPLAVLVGVAFLVGVLFAFRCVTALLAAVFGFELPVSRMERFTAPLTGDVSLFSVGTCEFASAFVRACLERLAKSYSGFESLAAGNARRFVALITVQFTGIVGSEVSAANGALLLANDSRGHGGDLGVLTAKLSVTPNLLGASWVGTKFACCHTDIISGYVIMRKLERWSVHTGRQPVLVEGA